MSKYVADFDDLVRELFQAVFQAMPEKDWAEIVEFFGSTSEAELDLRNNVAVSVSCQWDKSARRALLEDTFRKERRGWLTPYQGTVARAQICNLWDYVSGTFKA